MIKTFNTPKNFRKALEEIVSQRQVEELFEHENAHYEKAKKLGYSPYFIIRLAEEEGINKIYCSINLREAQNAQISPEHRIMIALAPKNPSEQDYMTAEECSISIRGRN